MTLDTKDKLEELRDIADELYMTKVMVREESEAFNAWIDAFECRLLAEGEPA